MGCGKLSALLVTLAEATLGIVQSMIALLPHAANWQARLASLAILAASTTTTIAKANASAMINANHSKDRRTCFSFLLLM
jgi:hypothetical protein